MRPKLSNKAFLWLWGLAAFLIFVGAGPSVAQEAPKGKKLTEEDAKLGKAVYEKRCIWCHGEAGDGNGPAADRLRPRPRDFTRGLFKIRTTPFGKIPTEQDIFRMVSEGMPGSSMPAWKEVLSRDEIWQAVAYVRTFSGKFKRAEESGEMPPSIQVGEPPKVTDELLAKGKTLFEANCQKCHGMEGRGDGLSAPSLKDSWSDRIWPRDLTKGWTFRGGNTVQDVYRTLMTGISGTPMPSNTDTFKEEDAWAVAQLVRSRMTPEMPKINEVIRAKPVKGEIPMNAEDPEWTGLPINFFPMVPQLIQGDRWFKPTLNGIEAKALFNEKEIGILLEWDDPTQSPLAEAPTDFPDNYPDQAAVQLPVKIPAKNELEKPYFLGGNPERPVNLWRWTAEGDPQELTATGFQKEEVQKDQGLKAVSAYKNGRWHVILKRSLTTPNTQSDIQFEVGRYIPVAFSAWDGNNGETAEKRVITIWYWLLLEPSTPGSLWVYSGLALLVVAGIELKISRSRSRKREN